jgi:hypothetical protein
MGSLQRWNEGAMREWLRVCYDTCSDESPAIPRRVGVLAHHCLLQEAANGGRVHPPYESCNVIAETPEERSPNHTAGGAAAGEGPFASRAGGTAGTASMNATRIRSRQSPAWRAPRLALPRQSEPQWRYTRSRRPAHVGSVALAIQPKTKAAPTVVANARRAPNSFIPSARSLSTRNARPSPTGPLHKPHTIAGTAKVRDLCAGRAYSNEIGIV